MTVESSGRIAGTHPVRKAFASCNGFYETISEALRTFNDALEGWPFYLDHVGLISWRFIDSATRIRIYNEEGRQFGCAYFEWSRVLGEGWEVRGRIR